MDNLPYVKHLLMHQFNLELKAEEIGYESVLFEWEELDTNLFPKNFDESQLEEEVLTHFYGFEEYGVFILESTLNGKWQLIGVLKDGELVYSQIPN